MARSDHSHPSDEGRRRSPQPGLSLSTGRLEGRPRTAAEARRTRHNPLRDDYSEPRRPYGERPRRSAPEDRISAEARPSRPDRHGHRDHFDYRDLRHDERRRESDRPHRAEERGRGKGPAPFAPQLQTIESLKGLADRLSFRRGSHRARSLDPRRIGGGVVAAALVIVFVMAVAHVGPFAADDKRDYSKHVGALGIEGLANNAAYVGQNLATQISLARPVEPDLAKLPAHTPTREDISSLSDQKSPFAFALAATGGEGENEAGAPVLSDRSLVSLSNALSYYDANGYEASYLLMDLGTGRGIAGNLDASIYGASSFKGPYCAYVVNKEFPNDINEASSSRITQVENSIVWSDNSSYGKLRRTYGNDGMREWLSEAGVSEALVDDTYFPAFTGRQAALMWLKIYDYLSTANTSAAAWLSDTFAKTEVSFLRNGALGTTSAGHTDYLPEEGSGTEEGVEETQLDEADSAEKGDDATSEATADGTDDKTDEKQGADGSFLAITLAEPVSEIIAETSSKEGGETGSENGGEASVETGGADKDAARTDGEAGDGADEEKTVASIGTNITVRNKAGWIDGEDDDAVCDSGIVTINDRDYLMVILTSAPDSSEGEQAFAHLARTLFEIRGDLV